MPENLKTKTETIGIDAPNTGSREIVEPIENSIAYVPAAQIPRFDRVFTLMSEITCLKQAERTELIIRLYQEKILENPPKDILEQIELCTKIREQEKARKRAEQQELQREQNLPINKFPRLFRRSTLECMNYIKTLTTEDLTALKTTFEKDINRWSSIMFYNIDQAFTLIQNELNSRR